MVVLPQLLYALNAINTQRSGDGQQPPEHIGQAIQIKAMQTQRAADKSEPRGHGFVFHPPIIATLAATAFCHLLTDVYAVGFSACISLKQRTRNGVSRLLSIKPVPTIEHRVLVNGFKATPLVGAVSANGGCMQ